MLHCLNDGELINIRPAKRRDWTKTMNMVFKVFMEYEAPEYGLEGTQEFYEFIHDDRLKKMFLNGAYILLVAENEDKEIIGMISLRSGNHISLLFVNSDYHKKGVATALMEEMIEILKEHTSYNTITVHAAPYATGFYHKLDFKDTDVQQQDGGIIYIPMEKIFRYDSWDNRLSG